MHRTESVERDKTDGGEQYVGNAYENWLKQKSTVKEVQTSYSSEHDDGAKRHSITELNTV